MTAATTAGLMAPAPPKVVYAPDRKFAAFISYKHLVSKVFAERIETALMTYAKPVLRRPRPVFRDERHLVPSPDLPGLIRRALENSEFLLLLASPEAAASPWVREEIDIFCGELDRAGNLIIVLTAGEIAEDVEQRAIVWDERRTTALPANLRRYLASIPLYIDLRWAQTEADLSLRHPRFKQEINRIVAHLRNVSPDDMLGEELRVWRRNLRLAGGAALILALAAVALVALAVGLRSSNRSLDEQRLVAEQNARRALRLVQISGNRLDAANASLLVGESPDAALALAAKAWRERPAFDEASLALTGWSTRRSTSRTSRTWTPP